MSWFEKSMKQMHPFQMLKSGDNSNKTNAHFVCFIWHPFSQDIKLKLD